MTFRSLLSVTLAIDNFFPRAGSFSRTLCVSVSVCVFFFFLAIGLTVRDG
jgi:hypothetical protein